MAPSIDKIFHCTIYPYNFKCCHTPFRIWLHHCIMAVTMQLLWLTMTIRKNCGQPQIGKLSNFGANFLVVLILQINYYFNLVKTMLSSYSVHAIYECNLCMLFVLKPRGPNLSRFPNFWGQGKVFSYLRVSFSSARPASCKNLPSQLSNCRTCMLYENTFRFRCSSTIGNLILCRMSL